MARIHLEIADDLLDRATRQATLEGHRSRNSFISAVLTGYLNAKQAVNSGTTMPVTVAELSQNRKD